MGPQVLDELLARHTTTTTVRGDSATRCGTPPRRCRSCVARAIHGDERGLEVGRLLGQRSKLAESGLDVAANGVEQISYEDRESDSFTHPESCVCTAGAPGGQQYGRAVVLAGLSALP